jgi:hypothetical protein
MQRRLIQVEAWEDQDGIVIDADTIRPVQQPEIGRFGDRVRDVVDNSRERRSDRKDNRADRIEDRGGNPNRVDRLRDRSGELDDRQAPRNQDQSPVSNKNKKRDFLSDSIVTAAGVTEATLTIRVQQDWFEAEDITLSGSTAGARVTSIYFGSKQVLDVPAGLPIEMFAADTTLRGMLKGHKAKGGRDVIIKGTVATAADTFAATILGWSPADSGC